MIQENKLAQIKLILTALAEYYRKPLTTNQLNMYAEDLMVLSLDELSTSIKRLRSNPDIEFFPLPSLIIQQISPDLRDESIEATNRILEAMAKFGYSNFEKAKEYIGALGWRVVEREGGWQRICESTTNKEIPILKAQWRELAMSTIRRARSGADQQPPAIPQRETTSLTNAQPISQLLNIEQHLKKE